MPLFTQLEDAVPPRSTRLVPLTNATALMPGNGVFGEILNIDTTIRMTPDRLEMFSVFRFGFTHFVATKAHEHPAPISQNRVNGE
jgi:hypothetical protein